MVNDRILKAVTIDRIEYSAEPDIATEYFLNLKVTGRAGEIGFVFGRGDHDIYITGAHEFPDIEDLLGWVAENDLDISVSNLNEETIGKLANELASLKGRPQKAGLYAGRLFPNRERTEVYLKSLILRKLGRGYRDDLEKFRDAANQVASVILTRWKSDSELL